MNVKTVVVGPIRTNCYLAIKENNVLIVDPGDELEKIKKEVADKKVLGVLLTHSHFDHIGALKGVLDFYNVPLYSKENVEEKEYEVDNFKFEVIFTPGHTSDSVTFYFKEDRIMFTGDFLFHEDIGYTHFPTGSMEDMKESLRKISKYQDAAVYPGHEEATTLFHEIEFNPYFREL